MKKGAESTARAATEQGTDRAEKDTLGVVAMPGHGLTGIRMESITYGLEFAGSNETELDRMIATR